MESTSIEAPLYGRKKELCRLASAMGSDPEHVRGGVVVGASGLGKTHLLAAGIANAKASGAVVLAGSCLDVGDSWPLHPLREAAQKIKADYGDLPAAGQLVDTLAGRVTSQNRADILATVHSELSNISRTHRLVLVIDDLQWADSSTIRLVRTLLSGLTSGSISFLGGLRTEVNAPPVYAKLLLELHGSPAVDVVELVPLDESSTRELARDISGRPISQQRGHRLWKRSGGVPILIKALAEREDSGPDALHSISVVLAARIYELSRNARDLMQIASLGIGPVGHATAKVVLGLDDKELLAAMREAVSGGVLVSVGAGYSPVHDLFGEIAREQLTEPEQIFWHRRIAEAIEWGLSESDPDPIALAHHWAGANDGERALPSFVAAARDASNQGASTEAWQWWQNVATILSGLPEHGELFGLLVEAAEAAHVVEEHEAALELLDRAEQLERDVPGASKLCLARSRYLAGGGHLEEAAKLCNEVFDDPQISPEIAVEVGAQSADLLTRLGRYEAAIERATETIGRLGEGSIDEASKLLATSALGFSDACLGNPEAARQSLSEALDRAVQNGDQRIIEAASRHYVDLLMGPLNELETGISLAEQQAQYLVDQGGEQRFTSSLLATASNGLFRIGRWEDARRSATAALEADPTGVGVFDLLLSRVRVDLGLGNFDAAEKDLRAASSLRGADPNPRHDLPLATLRAGLAIWRQDSTSARDEVSSVIERTDSHNNDDPWSLAPLLWHGLRAESLSSTPNVGRAFNLFTSMTNIRDDISAGEGKRIDIIQGFFLLCAGELDQVLGISRPAIWDRAADVWDSCGHPYPAAYARLQQAEAMFGERTRNSQAEVVLHLGYQSVVSLGAMPLAEQFESLALRARVNLNPDDGQVTAKPSEEPEAGGKLSALTVREKEIIVEVSQGLSNREIGERLYISSRTVGVHVSNILSKLGIKTRVEAAAIYIQETKDL